MFAVYVGGMKVGELMIPDAMRAALGDKGQEIELRDDAGKPLGRFVPAEPYCPWNPALTREELDRRSAAGGGIPLAEFWKRMSVE